ncbi:MAG: RNA polymerase sigma-70 factor, ECF subfamily [Parcubacteria group bacterium Gr01-1014_107]|nr:MAG: RNA polymerase sigma-70 factor, ECF subfamily [Parcubacteria group bacterium Gr01-1014_107]
MDAFEEAKREFIKAYDELADSLFRHCFFKVSDREKAKDLVQETFLRTWEYLMKRGEIANLKAFLYKVANNLVIDYYRKAKDFSLDSLQEEGFDPVSSGGEEIMVQAEYAQVTKALKSLDPKDREIIVMRFLNGLSPKEIGEILEVSENVVSVRLNRALKRLRQILGEA